MSRSDNATLFIRNVPERVRSEDLRRVFDKYGTITDIYIPLDYYTGRPRGFAYVHYEDLGDAEEALFELQGTRMQGRELEIEFARGDRKTPAEMRRKPEENRGGYHSDDGDFDYRSRSRSRSRGYSRSEFRKSSRDRRSRSRERYRRSRSPY